MPQEYLLVFAQALDEFRLPEVAAVCETLNIKISYDHETVNTAASSHAPTAISLCLLIQLLIRIPLCVPSSNQKEMHAFLHQDVCF